MRIRAGVIGYALLGLVLTDAFNTIVMARRTQHGFGVTRAFYRITYVPYAAIARRIRSGAWREAYLGVYGPLSLLGLIALWAVGLVSAFGLLQWSAGLDSEGRRLTLFDCVFTSSTTLSTLNTGNPRSLYSKLLIMAEGLMGLSFLGLVIGYLPVLYQRFAEREAQTSLLDARADSPPSALVLLKGKLATRPSLNNNSPIGKSGRPRCWNRIFPTRCWGTSDHIIRTSRG